MTDDTNKAATEQPVPGPGRLDVYEYVLYDINARVKMGEDKYGTKLRTFNGRDALWDAYQEALDLCIYLRQEICERDTLR